MTNPGEEGLADMIGFSVTFGGFMVTTEVITVGIQVEIIIVLKIGPSVGLALGLSLGPGNGTEGEGLNPEGAIGRNIGSVELSGPFPGHALTVGGQLVIVMAFVVVVSVLKAAPIKLNAIKNKKCMVNLKLCINLKNETGPEGKVK